MPYACGKCGTEVASVAEGMVRCPSCGYRILYKKRESVAKTVKVD